MEPKKPITGTMSPTLDPFIVAPAAPPYTYFGVAQNFIPGAKVLAAASQSSASALAFVSAHVLECLLKAYLSRDGSDDRLKKQPLCHNLNLLWTTASKEGLRVPASPPNWVDCLSGLHNRPYYLRYSNGVHGIVPPAAEPMTSELAALLEVVGKQVKGGQ